MDAIGYIRRWYRRTRFQAQGRRFVVLTAIVTGLGLPFSGLANHLLQMDPIFSVARHAWMSAHTMLGILFTLSVVSHAVFNRRMLLAYVRGQAARPGKPSAPSPSSRWATRFTRRAGDTVAAEISRIRILYHHAAH